MFTAPLFSALCALSAYLLVKEIRCLARFTLVHAASSMHSA